MGFKKYTYVPETKEKKAHYVDEEGKEVKGLKGTEPFKIYDEDNKKYLDYEHALAYLETIDDDDIVPDEEDEKVVEEETKKIPTFSEEGVRIINNNIINEEFENNNSEINNDKIINLKENDINDDEIFGIKENIIDEEPSLPKENVKITNDIITEKVENDDNEIIDDKIESKENIIVNKEKIDKKIIKKFDTEKESDPALKRDTDIYAYLGLDPAKDYTKQTISTRQFQKTLKKIFQTRTFDVYSKSLYDEDGNLQLDAYPISEILSSMLRVLGYKSVANDKDSKFYHLKQKQGENEAIEEAALEEIEQLDDKHKITALNNHNNVKGLINKENIKMEVGDTDIPENRKNKFINEERDVYDPIEQIKFLDEIQKEIIAAISGYNFPAASNIQFLDKKALKKGEYIYDDNALEKFRKKAFLSKEKAMEFIVEQIHASDFQREMDAHKIIDKNKEIDIDGIYEYNSKLNSYKKEHKGEKVVESSELKHEIIEGIIAENALPFANNYNNSIIEKLNSYKKLENFRSYRPKFYGFWHPFESKKEKNILNSMKKEIENSLIPNTDFSRKILECLNYKYKSNELKNNLAVAKTLNEQLENSNDKEAYINKFRDNCNLDLPDDFYKDEVKNIENKIEKAEEKENVKVQEKIVEKEKDKELNNDIKEL